MRLTNKSIIVTGAGSGIGEGIAKRLAAEGGKIVVNDLNAAGGERVTAEIKAAGGTALFVKADVTKDADFKRLVEAAVAAHGGLDSVGVARRLLLHVATHHVDRVLHAQA